MGIQPNAPELKCAMVAKGDFATMLGSRKLGTFLDWIAHEGYRHTAARDLKLLERALEEDDPVVGFWSYQTDTARSALGAEFLALASHRKIVRAEIAEFATQVRHIQSRALERLLPNATLVDEGFSPECLATLLTSIARNLNVENAVGISAGHAEMLAWVERLLKRTANDQGG